MNDLGYYLKVKFGLAPGDPTDAQLAAITKDLKAFAAANKREPTVDEVGTIAKKHCPSYGTYKYAADVNLELRRQIAQLAAQAKK